MSCTESSWSFTFFWQQYRQLFGGELDTVHLLNRTSGLFFRIVQDELWDSVLTEGQDDVMLYPVVASQLPIGRVPGHMFGWGGGNMRHLCRLLEGMGYRKVAGLIDNDQQAIVPKLKREFPGFIFFTIPAKDVRDKDEVEARPPVEGLLQNARVLREEYRERMLSIFEALRVAFEGEANQATASPIGSDG